MASEYKMNRSYSGVSDIVLTKGLYLESGLVNNASPTIAIDTGGTTTLFTVPAGLSYDISGFKFILAGANTTGTLILSIGTNAATYDNILASTIFTGFNTIGDMFRVSLNGLIHRAAATEVVTVNVTNPVTGTGAVISAYAIGEIN